MVVELKRAPIMAIKPTGEEVQLAAGGHAAAGRAKAAWHAESPAAAAQALPATASSLPLIGLFGLLALAGAFALRTCRKAPSVRCS